MDLAEITLYRVSQKMSHKDLSNIFFKSTKIACLRTLELCPLAQLSIKLLENKFKRTPLKYYQTDDLPALEK